MSKKTVKTNRNARWDILGIGNPLFDIVIEVEDSVLKNLGYKKGSMNLVKKEGGEKILTQLKHLKWEMLPGGSAANTLASARLLGNKAAFLGVIGKDAFGKKYEKGLRKDGVAPHLMRHNWHATGHAITLVTPDGERTFATHLGAASQLKKAHIKNDKIRASKILHIEGYQLETSSEAVILAAKTAKTGRIRISIDLSDASLIRRNKKIMSELVRDYADIVFANESEAAEFTGEDDPQKALAAISVFCETAVVKIGGKGSLIKNNGKVINVKPKKVKVANTIGAGDSYAAGILHGIAHGLDLRDAGKLGSLMAALTVASPGGRMEKKHHERIRAYSL